MKESRFPSMGLLLGFRVGVFETIAEGDTQAGRAGAMLDAANDSAVAWGAGAQGRKAFVAALEKLTTVARKFATKKSKDGTKDLKSYSSSEGGESENSYGKRIRALLVKGDTSIADAAFTTLKLSKGKVNDEKAVDSALQTLADSLGRFDVDLKEAEKTRKAETLAQRYKDAAANIITNGSQKKWVDTFTKEQIAFNNFLVAPTGTADEQAAILASNAENLAFAIKAREHKKNEEAEKKRQAEYQ